MRAGRGRGASKLPPRWSVCGSRRLWYAVGTKGGADTMLILVFRGMTEKIQKSQYIPPAD